MSQEQDDRIFCWPLKRGAVAHGRAPAAASVDVDWESVAFPIGELPGGLGVRQLQDHPDCVEIDTLAPDDHEGLPPVVRLGPAPRAQRAEVDTVKGRYAVTLREDAVVAERIDQGEEWPAWSPPAQELSLRLPDPLALLGGAPVEAWLREALDPPREGPLQQVAALALIARYGQAPGGDAPDQRAREALAALTPGDVDLLSTWGLTAVDALRDEVEAWRSPPALAQVQALAHQWEDLAGVLALARAAAPDQPELRRFWRALLDLESELRHQASLLPPQAALADDARLVNAAFYDPEAWWAPLTWG
jgi:hypothetical protein